MIKYSILTSDKSIIAQHERIMEWLSKGVKVLCFGQADDFIDFTNIKGYDPFKAVRSLQLYEIEETMLSVTVIDGVYTKEQLNEIEILASKVPQFNLEQYLVEHGDPERSHIIEASAGTGKTTVMIDRIMYLIHTVPDLSLADIAMITFTNEATQHMRHEVQRALLNRFKATKDPKYVMLLEDESKMRIHTIHSFSKVILSENGVNLGYSKDMKLRSFKYEKKQLIRDLLDEMIDGPDVSVMDQFGLPIHELEKMVFNYWAKFENIGIPDEDIVNLDWGNASNEESTAIHDILVNIFARLNSEYKSIKRDSDAISVGDIVNELRRVLEENKEPTSRSQPIKYLFIDEFQDSDNSQIKTILWLKQFWGFHLFAVGDVKQSIYRFRGAVETAFEVLVNGLLDVGDDEPIKHALKDNYRTSVDILEKMDILFKRWNINGLLPYDTAPVAQRMLKGTFEKKFIYSRGAIESYTKSILKGCLEDCCNAAKKNDGENDKTQRVTILTRTNEQLKKIAKWCEDIQVPCYIRVEGNFYASRAVRDFMAMISAYTFNNNAIYKYNYITSAYGPGDIDIECLNSFEGNSQEQNRYLDELLAYVSWKSNKRAFRLRPTLSVIRDIVEQASPTEKFISLRKAQLIKNRWPKEDLERQVFLEAKQFEKNTEKLMQMIRDNFSGEFVSLYKIYRFLSINIQTNRSEDEEDIAEHIGCGSVYGMTVHKAKGLEFDTVIIPFTNRLYRREKESEVLLNEKITPVRVGWGYARYENYNDLKFLRSNGYYQDCVRQEYIDVDKEEARLLYVAMTRSIRRLICLVASDKEHSWASLLGGSDG